VTPAYNETILDASVDSRQCWQNNGLTIGQPPVPIYGTEDCLTLKSALNFSFLSASHIRY
jgi:hypothetical protein